MKSKENTSLKSLLIALALCTLSACTDDELDNGQYTPTIGFTPTVSSEWLKGPSAEGRSTADTTATTTVTTIPLKGGAQPLYLHAVSEPIPDETRALSSSRGVTTATNGILSGSIGVSAHINGTGWYMQNVEVTSASNWTTEYYWPGAQYTGMDFFAYAPYNKDIVSYQREEPYYVLNVADEVANQVDFMVACHLPDENGKKPMENVPADKNSLQALKFQHICTAVKFALSDDIAAGKIKSITLKNIKNKGWYLNGINDADWGDYLTNLQPTGSKDFTISFGNSGLDMQDYKGKTIETYIYGDNKEGDATFYMIPQALDASPSIEVVFEFEGKEETYEATNLGTWEEGKMITYYISVSPESVGYTFNITPPEPLKFNYNGTAKDDNQTKFNVESKKTDGTSVDWSIIGYRTRDLTLDETAGTTTWTEGTWSEWITTPDGIDWIDLVTSGTEISPIVKSQKPTIIADYIDAFKAKTEQGSENSPVDLSYNNGTYTSNNRNTANCYVVNAPGVYSFPIIYGNVIVEGEVNESAYKSEYTTGTKADGTPSANAILSHFVGYDNNPIYNGMTKEAILANPYISGVASAKLLWQDGHDLVTDIRLSNDGKDVIFNVNEETICDGNAVIAVFNANNEIMWSWHIWVTHYDVSVNSGAIEMNYVPGYTQKIMPYNLGWCEADERYYNGREIELKVRQAETNLEQTITIKQNGHEKVKSYMGNNTFYQWGRKDPMRPAVYELNTEEDNPNIDNHKTIYTTDASYAWDVTPGPTTIANSIKTPYLFYTGNNYWPEAYYINLWNMNVGPTDYADNDNLKGNEGKVKSYPVAKTVYDPSPVGYQVPTWNAFYDFTSGFGEGGLNYGSENLKGSKKEESNKFLGVEFESNSTDKIMIWATGSRVAASGTYNGEQSHYWTAYVWCSYDKETKPYANVFQITNTGVTPWIYWIYYSCGCAVRPVTPPTQQPTE